MKQHQLLPDDFPQVLKLLGSALDQRFGVKINVNVNYFEPKNIINVKTYQQKGSEPLLTIHHRTAKKILIKDVVLLKGDTNYTIFQLQCGQKKIVPHSIKFFETFLATHGFLRIHRSFMINPNYIKEYKQNEEIVIMANGQEAFISRRKKYTMRGFND